MIKEIKTEIKKCDFCGKEVETFRKGSGEGLNYHIKKIEYEIWYGGDHSSTDICNDCDKKISTFLFNENLFNGVKK
jgi:hypothetical protein